MPEIHSESDRQFGEAVEVIPRANVEIRDGLEFREEIGGPTVASRNKQARQPLASSCSLSPRPSAQQTEALVA
jgi:hypothetical protein